MIRRASWPGKRRRRCRRHQFPKGLRYQGFNRSAKRRWDENFRGFARRSRSALLLGRKLQQRHTLGWRNPYGKIHVSPYGALAGGESPRLPTCKLLVLPSPFTLVACQSIAYAGSRKTAAASKSKHSFAGTTAKL